MKAYFTYRELLKTRMCYKRFLAGFKDFDPISEPDRPINLLKLLEINGIRDLLIFGINDNIQQNWELNNRLRLKANARSDSPRIKFMLDADTRFLYSMTQHHRDLLSILEK